MSGQGMSVKINVQAQIENLKQISTDFQKALETGVNKSSNSYKKLTKDLALIDSQLTQLSSKNPEGFFSSTGQLNSYERQYENLSAKLRTVATLMQNIGVEELNLDSADPAFQKLQELQKEAERLQSALGNIGHEAFSNFLKEDVSGLEEKLKELKVDPETATFKTALKALQDEAKALNNELKEAQNALNGTEKSISKTQASKALEEEKLTQLHEQNDTYKRQQNYLTARDSNGLRLSNGTYDGNQLKTLRTYALQMGFGVTEVSNALGQATGKNDDEIIKKKVADFYNKVVGRITTLMAQIRVKEAEVQKEIKRLDSILEKAQETKKAQQTNVNNATAKVQANTQSQNTVQTNDTQARYQQTERQLEQQAEGVAGALEETSSKMRDNGEAARVGADGINQLNNANNNLHGSVQTASGELTILQGKLSNLQYVQNAISRWFGFYQILNLTKRAVSSMVSTIKELDSAMTEIAVVTDMTQSDLWAQMNTYSDFAMQYGTSIKGVYEISALYYQQGMQTADVMAATEQTLKMAKIANLDYATATDYMTVA